jgi:hypothetical protein
VVGDVLREDILPRYRHKKRAVTRNGMTASGAIDIQVRGTPKAHLQRHPGLAPGSRATGDTAYNPGCRIKSGMTEEKAPEMPNVDPS